MIRVSIIDTLINDTVITADGQTDALVKDSADELIVYVKVTKNSGSNIKFTLQSSPDNSNWFDLDELTLSATINDQMRVLNFGKYVRIKYETTSNFEVKLWIESKS